MSYFGSLDINDVCLDIEVEFDYDYVTGVSPTKLLVDVTGVNKDIHDCTFLLKDENILQSIITSIMEQGND